MIVDIQELDLVYVANPDDMELIKLDHSSISSMAGDPNYPAGSIGPGRYVFDVDAFSEPSDFSSNVSSLMAIVIGRAQGAGASFLVVEYNE